MSQFLIVQGGPAEEVSTLYRRALSLFGSLSGIQPEQQNINSRLCAGVFSRLRSSVVSRLLEPGEVWDLRSGAPIMKDEGGLTGLVRIPESELTRGLKTVDGAFLLASGSPQELLIVTDRLGSIHAYLAFSRGCALVSSSSLILAALLQPEWDDDSCREFLAMGTVFENRTLFRGIEKLPPATIFRLRDGAPISRVRYWSLSAVMAADPPRRGGVPEMAEALNAILDDLTRRYPNPVFDLTGGFDSRIVVGAMMKIGRPFQTVVVGGKSNHDVHAACAIAERFGIPLRVVSPEWPTPGEWWETARQALPLCDGEYDVLEYARILRVHRALSAESDVSINGSNGEVCKGYWWELLFPHIGKKGNFDEHKIAAARFAFDLRGTELLAGRLQTSLARHFANVIHRANEGFDDLPNTAKLDNVYLTLRMQRWQGRIMSATDRIWPCFSPFAFREPLEIALATPPSVRVRNHMSRRLVEFIDPQLAAMPLAEGYPASPMRLTNLHRFLPMATEISGKVARRLLPRKQPLISPQNPVAGLWTEPEVCDLLDIGKMRTAPLYDGARLQAFFQSARSSDFSAASQFGRVLTLEMLSRLL